MRPSLSDDPAPCCLAQIIRKELAHQGVHSARPDEILQVRAMAVALISPNIARPEALLRVHAWSGAALFVTRGSEGPTGVLAVIPLSAAGLRALLADRFDSLAPEAAHVAPSDVDPAAIYVWGIAATNRIAAGRLSIALLAMAEKATPHLPYFARVATPIGQRLSLQNGFRPFPGSNSSLIHRQPASLRRTAA